MCEYVRGWSWSCVSMREGGGHGMPVCMKEDVHMGHITSSSSRLLVTKAARPATCCHAICVLIGPST